MNRNKRLALLLTLAVLSFWATSAWASAIGEDSVLSLSRTLVLPEDGSGGIAAADAVQFNTGFTLTALFGGKSLFTAAASWRLSDELFADRCRLRAAGRLGNQPYPVSCHE